MPATVSYVLSATIVTRWSQDSCNDNRIIHDSQNMPIQTLDFFEPILG